MPDQSKTWSNLIGLLGRLDAHLEEAPVAPHRDAQPGIDGHEAMHVEGAVAESVPDNLPEVRWWFAGAHEAWRVAAKGSVGPELGRIEAPRERRGPEQAVQRGDDLADRGPGSEVIHGSGNRSPCESPMDAEHAVNLGRGPDGPGEHLLPRVGSQGLRIGDPRIAPDSTSCSVDLMVAGEEHDLSSRGWSGRRKRAQCSEDAHWIGSAVEDVAQLHEARIAPGPTARDNVYQRSSNEDTAKTNPIRVEVADDDGATLLDWLR